MQAHKIPRSASHVVPISLAGAENRDVGYLVAVEIRGHRYIVSGSKPKRRKPQPGLQNVPCSIRRPVNRPVPLPIGVVIAGDGYVRGQPKVDARELFGNYVQGIPVALGRAVNDQLGKAVAIEIGRPAGEYLRGRR